jgi:uncharacterized damage-inducible protein DinB
MAAGMKAHLQLYLQRTRGDLLWKLDSVSEYDARRPFTPTGTNLLGLIKHVAGVEALYLGVVFGRPLAGPLPWWDGDAEPNADMWATAEESREQITGLYRRVWAHSDATIEGLDLDSSGHVPWWPEEQRDVTLHRVLVHVIAEINRHVGHADIVRELADGAVGLHENRNRMASGDPAWWQDYRERVERAAQQFRTDQLQRE